MMKRASPLLCPESYNRPKLQTCRTYCAEKASQRERVAGRILVLHLGWKGRILVHVYQCR